jgi:hypothetical protein
MSIPAPSPPGRESGVQSAWQPIETTPKTARARIVWCPERRNAYVVSWSELLPGWIFFGGGGWALREEPSHWMPLPAPPATP